MMRRILMVLTSHRLDCFRLCADLLIGGGSVRSFDRVVLLLNGVDGRHLGWIERLRERHRDIPWDVVAGPRGRGERISGLQNECVRRYPDALYFKIDEDTFVSRDWAEQLTATYRAHAGDPGLALLTPVIPNNSVGFCHLLNRFPDLMREYRARFDFPVDPVCDGTVWRYPQVAEWVMRRWLNLDDANARLRRPPPPPEPRFSHRFSINCICYDYRHWREMGGVQQDDEIGWGNWIPAHGKHVILVPSALVHHYSFFVQQDWLDRSSLLEDLRHANLPGSVSALGGAWARASRIVCQVPSVLARRFGRQRG